MINYSKYKMKLSFFKEKNIFVTMVGIFVLIFSFNINTAYSYQETTAGGQLSAEIFPQDPTPFTDVSIKLISYEVDLTRSNIIWRVNGTNLREGIGQNGLVIRTGAAGERIDILIEVFSQEKYITKKISILPSEVDILWESDAYVPNFYRGKSLATSGSNLKIVALPNFMTESKSLLNSKDLFYSWIEGSEIKSSGYGKNKKNMTLRGSEIEAIIDVVVSTDNGSIKSSKNLRISPENPLLMIYEATPLLGVIYERNIKENFQMNSPETTFQVEPYFFDQRNLKYSWTTNNETPGSSEYVNNNLTVRTPRDNAGESILNILVRTSNHSSRRGIKIKFGQTAPIF